MATDNEQDLKLSLTEPFNFFMSKIYDLPYWLKEAIEETIRVNINKLTINTYVYSFGLPVFQLIVPQLTFLGTKELETKSGKHDIKLYKFLRQVSEGRNLTEITLNNGWTLAQTAHIYSVWYSKEYLTHVLDVKVPVDAAYIAGDIKLGEYLSKLGLVNVEQIEQALIEQKDDPNNTLIGKIFTRMGLLKDEDIIHILKIKEGADQKVSLPRIK